MKYARVPLPVQITNPRPPHDVDSVTLGRLGDLLWFDDDRWLKPYKARDSLKRVIVECSKEAGEMLRFEQADHEILCDIIRNPKADMGGKLRVLGARVMLQLEALESCILNASDTEPT